MNIAEKMTELIPILHEGHGGLNGVRLPDVQPHAQENWTEDYACLEHVWPDVDTAYFDEDLFYSDLKRLVHAIFALSAEHVICRYRVGKQPSREASPTVNRVFIDVCRAMGMIEVCRVRKTPTTAPQSSQPD